MKKKHPEHVNLERWLVSYADFITLLFAFFVVMYAISQADMAKFRKVSASLNTAFHGSGPVGMLDLGGRSGGDSINQFELVEPPGGRVMNLPAGKTNTASDPDPGLQETKELLEETVSLELGASEPAGSGNPMQMAFDSRGLVVRLAIKDFFPQNSAEIKADLRPILDRIGNVLVKTRRIIRVEGHTDPSEEAGWELSTARSAAVVKYWIRRFELDPMRIGAAGYSHYRPLSRQEGELARAKNRRVEVIILNNKYLTP